MNSDDQNASALPAGKIDTGEPGRGAMDQGGLEPPGRPGLHHWKQATIVDPTLSERGGVFFAAVEMTRMPMILADPSQPDCGIAFANNAFLDLTGYEEAEVLGRNCRFLQGAGTDPEAVRILREAIAAQRPVALEILNYRRDGSPFWNAIFMGPVFDQSGQLIYFFASQLDVSKRRESEQSLRQAQKMEAIGQLTAGLAHDFNNLLQIVNGSLELMRAKIQDPAAVERHYTAALNATARGSRLTHQLLNFARRTRLEPRTVDLSDLVHSFAELLDTSVGKAAELHLNLQRRLPRVRIDPHHLEMALLNIVVNARDASPNGGAITVATRAVRLDDTAAHRLKSGDCVALSVTDQGIGMAAHVQARATEPFFTTKPPGRGTGLGLAMVHGFAEQSGGLLEIESEPGRGTTIRMVFPEAHPETERADDAGEPVGYQARPVADGEAVPSILVVDDSPETTNIAREALSGLGYHVVAAHSGEDALALAEQAQAAGHPFDLVFSDVLMTGGINGVVLAERLRERMPTMPVVLTTGYNDEMTQDGPRVETFEVLGKPWRQSELIDRVQAALRRGARHGPGRTTSDFGHIEA